MQLLEIPLILGGLLLLAISVLFWKQSFRLSRRAFRIGLAASSATLLLIAGYVLMLGSYAVWYTHRPIPTTMHQSLFQGITYLREVRTQPRPLVVHVITVDLDAPGLQFLVTPSQPTNGYQLAARTTSDFLYEFKVQLAINAGFFKPWHPDNPFNYYPRVGDGVDALGFFSSRGVSYSEPRIANPTLYISADNIASFHPPSGQPYNAISGSPIFVESGKFQPRDLFIREDSTELHPRNAVALDKSERKLILFVIDGRQPGYSEGLTIEEMADIVIQHGAYTAMNLDGGGSSTLVIQDESGWPMILNSPIDFLIPGREREVGNHLGIYALRNRTSPP
ncbi:MAG: phosphodiester glycosidase family protein [Chloroflexota bacterium]